MTNLEEIASLSAHELAKRLVQIRYVSNKIEYVCPDGTVFYSNAAIRHTENWLNREVVHG